MMGIRVLAIHHQAVAAGSSAEELEASRTFYTDLLGLQNDSRRPDFGIEGNWYFVGPEGRSQVHLVGNAVLPTGGAETPPNPLESHLAMAVESLDEARRDLEHREVPFLFLPGENATGVDQIFIRDPAGHVIELHEFGKCRCDRQELAE
jgi:catechol 2,3-dioxygenase-like lactoylglutathione lyase family enzyme